MKPRQSLVLTPAGGPLSGDTGAVTSVAFSPDGGRLASDGALLVTACRDRTVRVWELVPAVGDHPAGR
jgi:WD40 repeat protein